MAISKRDWLFIAVIAVVLAALFAGAPKDKVKNVPRDDKHRSFYELMRKGGDRAEVEKGCSTCHSSTSTPLPTAHPHKEQCLICHKLYPHGN